MNLLILDIPVVYFMAPTLKENNTRLNQKGGGGRNKRKQRC